MIIIIRRRRRRKPGVLSLMLSDYGCQRFSLIPKIIDNIHTDYVNIAVTRFCLVLLMVSHNDSGLYFKLAILLIDLTIHEIACFWESKLMVYYIQFSMIVLMLVCGLYVIIFNEQNFSFIVATMRHPTPLLILLRQRY